MLAAVGQAGTERQISRADFGHSGAESQAKARADIEESRRRIREEQGDSGGGDAADDEAAAAAKGPLGRRALASGTIASTAVAKAEEAGMEAASVARSKVREGAQTLSHVWTGALSELKEHSEKVRRAVGLDGGGAGSGGMQDKDVSRWAVTSELPLGGGEGHEDLGHDSGSSGADDRHNEAQTDGLPRSDPDPYGDVTDLSRVGDGQEDGLPGEWRQ